MKEPKTWHEIKINVETKTLPECVKICKIHKYPLRIRHVHDFSGGNVTDVLCTKTQFEELKTIFKK